MDSKCNENENKKHEESGLIGEHGTALLPTDEGYQIQLITIIGEIEGHDNANSNSKTTKYEHLLPILALAEQRNEIGGVLLLLNTLGGDVEAGLAIAEMISGMSKPVVSLVLGGSHSIGVPLAVSADYSFIAETATMVIHPVRMNGMIIGVAQSFEYMEQIQERILGFVVKHTNIDYEKLKGLMLNTQMLTKDIGTILVGKETVEAGIINEIGGVSDATKKLMQLIGESRKVKCGNDSNDVY